MNSKSSRKNFSKAEAERRFQAAIRGAFETSATRTKSIAPKRRAAQKKKKKAIKA